MELGISPHRYSGWEPEQRTRFFYDDEGRVAETVTSVEPEWDEFDRAMIDAYLDYRSDLHTCGRPLSESLKDDDKPDPQYQVGYEVCRACAAFDKFSAEQAKKDKDLHEAGRHPESYRITTVLPLAELPEETQQAIIASRRNLPS